MIDYCWDCILEGNTKDVDKLIKHLEQQRDQAIKERDEARREICEIWGDTDQYSTDGSRGYAKERGWDDLYKEEDQK